METVAPAYAPLCWNALQGDQPSAVVAFWDCFSEGGWVGGWRGVLVGKRVEGRFGGWRAPCPPPPSSPLLPLLPLTPRPTPHPHPPAVYPALRAAHATLPLRFYFPLTGFMRQLDATRFTPWRPAEWEGGADDDNTHRLLYEVRGWGGWGMGAYEVGERGVYESGMEAGAQERAHSPHPHTRTPPPPHPPSLTPPPHPPDLHLPLRHLRPRPQALWAAVAPRAARARRPWRDRRPPPRLRRRPAAPGAGRRAALLLQRLPPLLGGGGGRQHLRPVPLLRAQRQRLAPRDLPRVQGVTELIMRGVARENDGERRTR